MKKIFIALCAIFSLFLFPNIVKAEETSLHDFIESYGISGPRFICVAPNYNGQRNEYWCVKSSEGNVVVIYNTNTKKSFMVSNSTFQPGVAFASGSTTPPIDDFTNYGDQNLSSGSVFNSNSQLANVFSDSSGTFYWCQIDNYFGFNQKTPDVQFNGSKASFDSWLDEHPYNENMPAVASDLPLLTFSTNSKSFYKFPNTFDVKGTFTWNYQEHQIYADNPTDFVMDLTASARLDSGGHVDLSNTQNLPLDSAHSAVISNGGAIVSVNEYSFAYKEFGKLVYATYGYNKFPLHDDNAQGMAEGYCVYIRTRQLSTGQVSAWKIFTFQGGIFEPSGYAESTDGVKPLTPNQSDPQNSSPLAPYTQDNNTSAQSDPSSSNFQGTDNYDPSTVIFNLKQTVSAIGDLPSMLADLITFIPAWLVSLIFVSIGLVVVVGVVKLIIR